MSYTETFKVGDRIAFDNFEFYSYGVITRVMGPDSYEIKWDDGFDDNSVGGSDFKGYSADEITHEYNVQEIA